MIGQLFLSSRKSQSGSRLKLPFKKTFLELFFLSQEYEQRLAGLGVPVENASWRSATADELTTIKEAHSNNNNETELKKSTKRRPSSSNSPCTTGILLEGEDSPTTNSSPTSSNGEQDEMET